MSKVRDRFDSGLAPTKLDRMAALVRQQTQRECENTTIARAWWARERGEAGPFALAVLDAYRAEGGAV